MSIIRALKEIDNEMRPERNRLVHDVWIQNAEKFVRRTYKTILRKPQAFKLELLTKEEKEYTAQEVWDFQQRIKDMLLRIARLMHSSQGRALPPSLHGK